MSSAGAEFSDENMIHFMMSGGSCVSCVCCVCCVLCCVCGVLIVCLVCCVVCDVCDMCVRCVCCVWVGVGRLELLAPDFFGT